MYVCMYVCMYAYLKPNYVFGFRELLSSKVVHKISCVDKDDSSQIDGITEKQCPSE